jgi:hypothetical protein
MFIKYQDMGIGKSASYQLFDGLQLGLPLRTRQGGSRSITQRHGTRARRGVC